MHTIVNLAVGKDATASRSDSRQLDVCESFVALFSHKMRDKKITRNDVASRLQWHRNRLYRVFAQPRGTKAEDLLAISNALDIDHMRATVAIGGFGDWRMYYDSALIIVMDLIKPVVETVDEMTTTSLEPLRSYAKDQFSRWIAETLVNHQQFIGEQQEKIQLKRNA